MIVKGAEQIEFFTRFEPGKKGPPVYFLDKIDALAFLKRLFMNAWDRSELRSLLSKVEGAVTVEKMTDGEVMALLAEHLVSGKIWAVRVRLLRRSRSAEPRGYMTPLEVSREERKPPPPEPKKEEAKPPPPPAAEPEVSPEIAEAQAAALKQAAESGKPFCEQWGAEEPPVAVQEEPAVELPPPEYEVSPGLAAAQAATLKKAAQSGAPFCEQWGPAAPPVAAKIEAEAAPPPPRPSEHEMRQEVAAAQAATLKHAAQTGTPFCEQWGAQEPPVAAQAGTEAEAFPPRPPEYAVSPEVAASQATTFREASAAGSPFCEPWQGAWFSRGEKLLEGNRSRIKEHFIITWGRIRRYGIHAHR